MVGISWNGVEDGCGRSGTAAYGGGRGAAAIQRAGAFLGFGFVFLVEE